MLVNKLHDAILQLGLDKHYLVAFSGGMDSHVLLKLCVMLRQQISLQFTAIHVHHGISPYADHWSQHCKKICDDYQVPLVIQQLAFHCEVGDSLEQQARHQRYEMIAASMTSHSVLLTAHHQDDQAETFLLQLMRGAGLKGLSAMPFVKPFATGLHARPLLTTKREDLLAFANEHHLQWIEDESNRNENLSRNYLRHQVLPLLTAHWPSAQAMIARSAKHCAEAESVLTDAAQKKMTEVLGSQPNTLSVLKLKQLDDVEQKRLLRMWIDHQGYTLPNINKLSAIMTNVLDAAPDKQPEVIFGDAYVRRFRDDLFLLSCEKMNIRARPLHWNLREYLLLPNGKKLLASKTRGRGLRQSLETVVVRSRQGGETVFLSGRGHRTLKKMFNEWGILPWEREQIPLIFLGQQLLAVVGYYYHPEWIVSPHEMGMHLICEDF